MKALQKTKCSKILSLLLLLLLTAAIAISVVSCNDVGNDSDGSVTTGMTTVATTGVTTGATTDEPLTNVRGEGNTQFLFKVVTASGETKTFTVKTDKTTVGQALLDAGLIEGEDGQYGLYVKTVDGETLDYNKDGMYWSFYVGDGYALKGVDMTEIEAGVEYSFRAAKG